MQILFQNFNLAQGYNTAVNPYLNKAGEAREALGCDFSEIGSISRFPGYESVYNGLGASDVLGLYDYKTVAGGTVFLAVNGTVLYYLSGSTWTSALTGLTTGLKAEFATLLDTVIMVNGTDVAKKSTNGTSWSSLGGTPPVAKYVITFDNKIYMLNISGATSRIRWSDDGTIETWTSTNFIDIATNIGVGDQITGGAVNNNSLIIFKNYSTWKWDTFQLVVLHSNVGCRSPRSIATIDDKTFWLSHKGVMMSDGGKPVRISKQVQSFIDGISDLTSCIGWAKDNFYYLYIGTSNGVTNCLLIYDMDSNVWSYKSMADTVKVAATLTAGDSASQFSYFGNSAGQVYKFKSGNTDGTTAIPFKWVSSIITSQTPHRDKWYKYLYVFMERSADPGVDVSYSINGKDFISIGTAKDQVSRLPFPAGAIGQNIQICYSSNHSKDQQKIRGHLCFGDILPSKLFPVT